MPTFETDSPVIIGMRDALAKMVNEYRAAFSLREAAQNNGQKPTLTKALSFPLSDAETLAMDEVTDGIMGYEYPDDEARCAVVFAHLSQRLTQLAEHFAYQSSLFTSSLTTNVESSTLSNDELAKLGKDCSSLFQSIIDFTDSPEAAGQPFTVKAGNKGCLLNIPRFHNKVKEPAEHLHLYVDGFPYVEDINEPYVNNAINMAFSIKASEFLKQVPFKPMDSTVPFTNPHNSKVHQVQWKKVSD
jgi:hypothetical protein